MIAYFYALGVALVVFALGVWLGKMWGESFSIAMFREGYRYGVGRGKRRFA